MKYQLANSRINKSWNHFSLSCGLYSKDLDYDLFRVKDQWYIVGFGVEYLENRNSLNFGFRFGTRESDFLDFNNSKYYNFYFTISSSEEWYKERE